MKIVTGYGGEPHITAADDQALHTGIFGMGNYVLNVRNKFAATIVNNNQIRIADGEGVMQGVHFRIDTGTYDYCDIENGASNKNRKDLIVARYTKDSDSGVESVTLAVIKGTASSGTASEPSYNTGDIASGSLVVDFPLYVVNLSGLTVSSVTAKFSVLSNIETAAVPVKVTVSAGTNVTINRQNVYKIGKLCVVSLSISTSATITGSNNLITGLPTPPAIVDTPMVKNDNTGCLGIVNASGYLRFGASSGYSAGTFQINAAYICS